MKDKFISDLKETGKKGIEDLLAYLEEVDFYEKPASIRHHLNRTGGLLEHTENVKREYLLSHSKQKVNNNVYKKYKNAIFRRKEGVPFAHLIGRQEFYSLKFKIDKNVLIPRPETELLVDEVLKE